MTVTFSKSKGYITLTPTIKLNFRGSPGLLLVGRSGMGKTQLATYISLKFMSQMQGGLLIVDNKRSDLSTLSNYLNNGKQVVATTVGQTARLLRNMVDNMNNRASHFRGNFGQDWLDYNLRPYLILIDEVAALMAEATTKEKNELMSLLRQLILKGRQAGIFVILSAQRLEATVIDRSLTLQLGNRIIMGNADSETYRMVFPGIDTKELPKIPNKPGFGLIEMDGQANILPVPFVAPDMSNVNVPNVISKLENNLNLNNFADETGYWQ